MSAETESQTTPSEAPEDIASWAAEDPPEEALAEEADGDNAHVEGDDEPPPEGEGETEAAPEGEPAPEPESEDEPPEFWKAEHKALWPKVTDPEVRAAIKEHVSEASRVTSQKMEDAAAKARAAEESAQAALANQEKAVTWWKQNGPLLQQIIAGKWAGVDWNKLAAEDPAGYVTAKHQHEQEQGWLQGMAQRHQQEAQQIEQRRAMAHQEERRAHHEKLAAKFPAEFGTQETAQKTYTELSSYLSKQGIPAERISQVYEAPIVEIVRKAYKYDQLQAKAKTVTKSTPSGASASTTPKRVVPGASQIGGANPTNEASRQALERLKSGERSGPDMAMAFR